MKDLKSELGGNLEEVTLAMMEPCELFDAKSLRKAMKVFVLRAYMRASICVWCVCVLHACVWSLCVCVCVCVCMLIK